jgi:dTMP kinase
MRKIYLRESDFSAKFILVEGLNGSGKTTQAKILTEALMQSGISAVFNHEPSVGVFGRIIRRFIDQSPIDHGLLHLANDLAGSRLRDKSGQSPDQRQFYGVLLNVLNALEKGNNLTEWEKQTLFVANRLEDLEDNIFPNLQKKTWVVQDRYDLSCFFHGMSNGVNFNKLLDLHQKVLADSYLAPDLIIYYWLPVPVALERLKSSGKIIDIYENEKNLGRIEKAAREILEFTDEVPKPQQPLVREFKMFHNIHKVLIINAEPGIKTISEETWSYVKHTFSA